MAVTDNWASGETFTAADEDLVAQAINGSGWLQPCICATTGSESYTISSGSVTQISGTAIDGVSPSVGGRVLIKDAPLATGSGSPFSSAPANGVYEVTDVTSVLTLSRIHEMAGGAPFPYFPGGWVVAVMGGTNNGGLTFVCTTPNNPAISFAYGADNIRWAPNGYVIGTGLAISGSTVSLSGTTLTQLALASSSLQTAGNVLTVSGSQVKVSTMSTGQVIFGNAGTPTIGSLGGDATISATGSLTIASGAVGLGKMANLAAHSVIGNATGSSATPGALALTSSGAPSSVTMTDANGNLTANSLIEAVQTTTTAGGTTTLTVSSQPVQQFTGTATQTVVLPSGTTLSNGQQYLIANRSSGVITVEANGGSTLQAMAAGSQGWFTLTSNVTSNGTWDVSYTVGGTNTVTGLTINTSNGFAGSATAAPTPAITLTTTITGLLKGNGTAISAAVSGTDYAPATTGTSILKASSGGFANAVAGTDYAVATTGSLALAGNGSGGFQNATLNMVGTPTANFSMGGFLINSLGTPSASTDAATKGYVDTLVQGLSAKYSAVASTNTETITIASGNATQITGTTVDGVSPNIGDYVLLMNAPSATGAAGGTTLSTQPANGLYQVSANTTNLTIARAADMSGSIKPDGVYVFVAGGSTWGSGGFVVTTPSTTGSFTYGTNNIAFTQFTGAGEITAGTGISKSGNALSVNLTGGTAITVTGASIAVTSASIGTTQLSATGTKNSTTYLRGDNTWASFAAAVGTTWTAGTGISITGSTISVTNSSIGPTQLSATGTASSTTFLRGDNTWSTLSGIPLSSLGTPTANVSWGGFGITSLANPTTAQGAATKAYVDSTGLHPACNWATTGTENFTIVSGTVTQISGTSLDSGSPSVGDRILIKDAPASSGFGSVLSANPGNGIYVITSNTTNLSVTRTNDLSGGGVYPSPAGGVVVVSAGLANASTSWLVTSPTNQDTSFTYGTTGIQWGPFIAAGNVLLRLGNVIQVASMATGTMIFGNAGNPTIGSITGDWAISSSGVTTIGTGAVTLPKMASLAASSIIGNTSGSSATPTAVPLTISGAASSVVSTDANANITGNNLIQGWATTTSSGGTTTLTVASAQVQQFTGSNNQTVKLPTTGIVAGMFYRVINATASNAVTVTASGGITIEVLGGGTSAWFVANSPAPTTPSGWSFCYEALTVSSGKVPVIQNSITFAGTDSTTMTFPGSSDTVVTLAASQTLANKTFSGGVVECNQFAPSLLTSSTTTLTLSTSNTTYVYTGSSASTWTLPAVSGNTATFLSLYNRGSNTVTIQRAGTDNLYDGAIGSVTSVTMAAGASIQLYNDGTYWLVVVPAGGGGSVNKYTSAANPASTTWTVTHNLGTQAVTWALYTTSSMVAVNADFASTSTTQSTFTFQTAPAANTLTCVIVG